MTKTKVTFKKLDEILHGELSSVIRCARAVAEAQGFGRGYAYGKGSKRSAYAATSGISTTWSEKGLYRLRLRWRIDDANKRPRTASKMRRG